MKYFIDFEANDEQEIIAVGCIDASGRTFYSLINNEKPLSEFIANLTGIKNEDLEIAPTIDEVFEDLYDFCDINDIPQFYCYGDGDINFVASSFNNTKSFKAACMLGYLYTNMSDYSIDVKDHFYVNKTISLEKVSNYYLDEYIEQNHNALDDAIRLKIVFDNVENSEKEINVFSEYLDTFTKKRPTAIKTVVRMSGKNVVEAYSSMEEAVKWVLAQPYDDPNYVKNAAEKIRKAANENIKYCKCNWRIL